MLRAAEHIHTRMTDQQTTELVWTGPRTPFVSPRRTEQALLEVINGATWSLFLTSYVAYDIANVVRALNDATERGVQVHMLLERPRSDGGAISFDAMGRLRQAVLGAHFFTWEDAGNAAAGGSVHAKVAVADDETCFITSANLTGSAMERNMEAGVLIRGGELPRLLGSHLRALVETKIVVPA
jgi:cardiolipin synthase